MYKIKNLSPRNCLKEYEWAFRNAFRSLIKIINDCKIFVNVYMQDWGSRGKKSRKLIARCRDRWSCNPFGLTRTDNHTLFGLTRTDNHTLFLCMWVRLRSGKRSGCFEAFDWRIRIKGAKDFMYYIQYAKYIIVLF